VGVIEHDVGEPAQLLDRLALGPQAHEESGELHRAGLAEQETFELPISQVIIADALGLSTVHINRTFQQLKRDRIVQSEGHRLAITNFPALCRLAGRIAGDGGLDKDTDRI